MKKPEKTLPLCPLIQSECVEDGCKFWLQMERKNISTGVTEKYQECAFIVQIGVVTENSRVILSMNETLQHLRNETLEVGTLIQQQPKRLGGKN